MPSANAPGKPAVLTLSQGGTPPYGPVKGASSGSWSAFCFRSATVVPTASDAGTARRHSLITSPRDCAEIVDRQVTAISTVSTLARLSGDIIARSY